MFRKLLVVAVASLGLLSPLAITSPAEAHAPVHEVRRVRYVHPAATVSFITTPAGRAGYSAERSPTSVPPTSSPCSSGPEVSRSRSAKKSPIVLRGPRGQPRGPFVLIAKIFAWSRLQMLTTDDTDDTDKNTRMSELVLLLFLSVLSVRSVVDFFVTALPCRIFCCNEKALGVSEAGPIL